jgi:hypothetical protein
MCKCFKQQKEQSCLICATVGSPGRHLFCMTQNVCHMLLLWIKWLKTSPCFIAIMLVLIVQVDIQVLHNGVQ